MTLALAVVLLRQAAVSRAGALEAAPWAVDPEAVRSAAAPVEALRSEAAREAAQAEAARWAVAADRSEAAPEVAADL